MGGALVPDALVRRKKPSATGCAGFAGGSEDGGDSGWATIDPAARGDDALGRVETPPFMRLTEPPDSRDDEGMFSDTACFGCEGVVPFEVVFASAVEVVGLLKLPKLIPENDGKGIFACSRSSIGGRSSSLAEYRPVLLGEPARELL